ncbi:MAG: BlaI/MecI/CopY family transcriptional regulator [Chloroflexi bacterium]|nr:BlaI/MecI/CopY family transcriptional regulator [Chloroflexota bacterium]
MQRGKPLTPKGGSIRIFKLNRSGLSRILGELEARITEAVWDLEQPTVQDVCDRLGGKANYRTVMTVMNRLVKKGLLRRYKEGRAFRYVPSETREAFLESVSQQVVRGLLDDFGELALAQFVDVLDEIPAEQIEALRELIRRRGGRG